MHRFTGPSAASPALRSSLLGLMLGRSMYHRALKGAATRICPHQIRLWAHQVEAKVPGPPRPPRRRRPSRPVPLGRLGHTERHRRCGATARQPRRTLAHRADHRGDRRPGVTAPTGHHPVSEQNWLARATPRSCEERIPASEPAGQQTRPQIGARLVTSRTAANCCLSWCVADREAAYVSAAACRSCVCADK